MENTHSTIEKETFILEALKDALGYFNMKAQRQTLGLEKEDDDTRQKLCNAIGALSGDTYCGNLQRTEETRQAIKKYYNEPVKDNGLLLAMEFGYKQCEKGNNLDHALIELNKLLK